MVFDISFFCSLWYASRIHWSMGLPGHLFVTCEIKRWKKWEQRSDEYWGSGNFACELKCERAFELKRFITFSRWSIWGGRSSWGFCFSIWGTLWVEEKGSRNSQNFKRMANSSSYNDMTPWCGTMSWLVGFGRSFPKALRQRPLAETAAGACHQCITNANRGFIVSVDR